MGIREFDDKTWRVCFLEFGLRYFDENQDRERFISSMKWPRSGSTQANDTYASIQSLEHRPLGIYQLQQRRPLIHGAD